MDKLFRVCGNLYNNLVSNRKKALFEMEKTKAWCVVQSELHQVYSSISGDEPTEEEMARFKLLFSQRNEMLKAYGFGEFAFMSRIQKWRHHHKGLVNTHVAQKVASDVWKKFDDYFFGDGKEIRFKGWEHFFSIEGKNNSTGIRFCESASGQMVMRVNKVDIPVEIPNTDYVREALKCRVKFCRIVRIPWHGKYQWLYSLQLILEGTPPGKNRPEGKGSVGIDIGTQTIAVVADNAVMLKELAPGANTPHAELRRIQRAMDRSRRASNPEMFNEDGTVIPIDKLPIECVRKDKRLWKESRHYKKLRQQRRYLFARLARIRRCQHNEISNRIRILGDTFYVETMRFSSLQKREKPSVDKEAGRQKHRKRFGKSIANKAPATMVNTIEAKVMQDGGHFCRIATWKAKASQYDHTDNTCYKKSLSKRWTTLQDGNRVQRDLYSALLLQNTNETLDGFIQENVEHKFPHFMQMHNAQIEALKYIRTPSSTGVKCIV